MTEHRRIHNGEDNLDTCTVCAWASWDTAPSFAEHVIAWTTRAPTCPLCDRPAHDYRCGAWPL